MYTLKTLKMSIQELLHNQYQSLDKDDKVPEQICKRYICFGTKEPIFNCFDGTKMYIGDILTNLNVIATSCPIYEPFKQSQYMDKTVIRENNINLLFEYMIKDNVNLIAVVADFPEKEEELNGPGFVYFPTNKDQVKTYNKDNWTISLKCINSKEIIKSSVSDEFVMLYDIELIYDTFKEKVIKNIQVIHYNNWIDRTNPKDINMFYSFIKYLYNKVLNNKKMLIHCSAGVGRTGISTVCLHLYHQVLNKKIKTNDDIVKELYSYVVEWRKKRTFFVQQEIQYIFCYDFCKMLLEKV